jgi:hypothetical protein
LFGLNTPPKTGGYRLPCGHGSIKCLAADFPSISISHGALSTTGGCSSFSISKTVPLKNFLLNSEKYYDSP